MFTRSPAALDCKTTRFVPTLEGLEGRCTPANVSASIQDGILTLRADLASSDEEFEIVESADNIPGHLNVTGLNGTTIENLGTFIAKGVRSIVFDMRGGSDDVDFEADIAGSLVFNGGGGTNTLSLGFNCIVGGSVRYLNGSDTANIDLLYISFGSLIGRNVSANFGKGGSEVLLSDVTIGGKLTVTAGGGIDSVEISDTVICGAVTAKLGNGANLVSIDALGDSTNGAAGGLIGGALTITTGSGDDNIILGDENKLTVAGKLSIASGDESAGGGDTVKIDDTEFLDAVFLDLGAGGDLVVFELTDNGSIYDTTLAGKLTILGGSGSDIVFFGASTGNRKLELSKQPALNGGGGTDTLNLQQYSVNGVDSAVLAPVSFETIT